MQFEETAKFRNVFSRIVASRKDCAALDALGISEVGITHVGPGWCFIRMKPAVTHILVTVSGRGSVICEGRWTDIGAETAYVMPRDATHGYQVSPEASEWRYVWVCLRTTDRFPSLFSGANPRIFSAPSYSLHSAVRGLIGEAERSRDPQLTGLWCDLVQSSLQHLVNPAVVDPRLSNLWSHINEHLAEPWDILKMAARANLSREHLRRLCQRDFGCSPGHRLTTLRLRRSCDFLLLTDAKLSLIAESVGFSDQFSYSQAFKREFGISPSVYRQRSKSAVQTSGMA